MQTFKGTWLINETDHEMYKLHFQPTLFSCQSLGMSVRGKEVLSHLRELKDHLGVLRREVLGSSFKILGAEKIGL